MNFISFDQISIVFSAILLIVGIVSPLFSPFFRFRRPKDGEGDVPASENDTATSLPPVAIVITPHNQSEALERHLPAWLHQDYPTSYQVIVVTEDSDREINDVLKRTRLTLKNEASQASLYVTSIQESSRFMSRKKLAITLGIKAAQSDWIVLVEADSEPAGNHWLRGLMQHATQQSHLIIGYSNYAPSASSYIRFERLYMDYYLMREDARGIPYRTNSRNLALRKSDFMRGNGFLGDLSLIRGEYDFLVNKYAPVGECVLALAPQTWVVEDAPSHKAWLNRQIFYMETRRFLSRSFIHRLLFCLDQTVLHLSLWAIIAGVAYSLLTTRLLVLIAALVAFIIYLVGNSVMAHRAMKEFREPTSVFALLPYQLTLVWHYLGYIIRHRLANRLDFTTHKQ